MTTTCLSSAALRAADMPEAATLLARVRRARHYLRTDTRYLVDQAALAELLDDVARGLELRDDLLTRLAPLVMGGERGDGLLGVCTRLVASQGLASSGAVLEEHRKQIAAAVERAAREG